ncbi:MAG: winged helix-turn-helix transcriptional regulator [Bacteroidetes bacterium]|nr:winged helix-turn-helix transcriptional regulator [Bacteroidota bacterium]
MKRTYLIGGGLAVCSLFLFAFALNRIPGKENFNETRAKLVIRNVGHQLLLRAGDSTSRILPVKQISSGQFQLEFQHQFSFKPDTLVKIVMQNLAANHLPVNYLVSVLDCDTREVVYGFEINPQNNNLISCKGRTQPSGCYTIQIAFVDFEATPKANPAIYLYAAVAVSLSLLAFIGYSYRKEKQNVRPINLQNAISLGQYLFLSDQRLLTYGEERIELSDKECRLLELFAAQPNQLIERDRLLKIWEDDGVFTARSLDVFVSKLRKKLSRDSSLQITNVYGKGYKLEIIA